MNSHDFYLKETDTGTSYFIELYTTNMRTELRYQFWHKIDPCCRKPSWFWARFSKYYFNSMNRREKFINSTIEVDESWALKHYDWDIREYQRGKDDG